jgi:hypothetical protein
MSDRQIVLLGNAPYRVEVGILLRDFKGDQWLDRHSHFESPHWLISPEALYPALEPRLMAPGSAPLRRPRPALCDQGRIRREIPRDRRCPEHSRGGQMARRAIPRISPSPPNAGERKGTRQRRGRVRCLSISSGAALLLGAGRRSDQVALYRYPTARAHRDNWVRREMPSRPRPFAVLGIAFRCGRPGSWLKQTT